MDLINNQLTDKITKLQMTVTDQGKQLEETGKKNEYLDNQLNYMRKKINKMEKDLKTNEGNVQKMMQRRDDNVSDKRSAANSSGLNRHDSQHNLQPDFENLRLMISHLQEQLNSRASLEQMNEVENTLKFNFAQVRRDLKQQIKRLNGFIHEQ